MQRAFSHYLIIITYIASFLKTKLENQEGVVRGAKAKAKLEQALASDTTYREPVLLVAAVSTADNRGIQIQTVGVAA